MDNVLELNGVTKSFGKLAAVREVSFAVERRELVGLIGPNGAGKSTLFNMINGQLKPDTGTIFLNGKDVTTGSPREKFWNGITRTFQVAEVFPSLTAVENIQLALASKKKRLKGGIRSFHKIERTEAFEELRSVGMAELADVRAGSLAYGDVKRLELGMALAPRPELLLLDEPTAGMAVGEREQLINLISSIIRDRGITVLFTEHSMDMVFGLADRICVLAEGQIIAIGAPQEIRSDAMVKRVYLGTGKVTQTGRLT